MKKKQFIAAFGSSVIYTDEKNAPDFMMLLASQDALFYEFDTWCRHVCSEFNSKQLVMHRIGNLSYIVIISNGPSKMRIDQQQEQHHGEDGFFDEEVDHNNKHNHHDGQCDSTQNNEGEAEDELSDDGAENLLAGNDEESENLHGCMEPVESIETEAALFRQLCLLHDLVCFRIPIQPNQTTYQMNFSTVEANRLLHPLVDTMRRMSYTHQSILVQGIEYVELGSFLRDEVTESVQKIIRPHGRVLHAVLFVGTKLASVCSRSRSWVLSPRDLLCLLIYTESLYHVSKAEEAQNQQQDQQQRQQQQAEEQEQQQQQETGHHEQEQQEKTPEEHQNHDGNNHFDPLFGSSADLSSPGTSPTESLADSFHSMRSNQQSNPMADPDEKGKEYEEAEYAGEPHASKQSGTRPDSVFDNIFLRLPKVGLVRCGVYSKHDKKNNITLLLIYDPKIEKSTAPEPASNNNEQQQQQQPPVVEAYKQDLTHLQQLIFCELVNFSSFLRVKAHAHITMMHYLHYCPGIVHFVFVDRIRNRVIAPRIVPLFNNNSERRNNTNTDTDIGDSKRLLEHVSVHFLRRKVWEMCQLAQQHRDLGYTEIGIGGPGIQYWFKEWIEDEHGNELKFTEKSIMSEVDGFAHARAHYELYTMYLPFVSTQAIAHYNRILTHVLLDRSLDKLSGKSGSFSA